MNRMQRIRRAELLAKIAPEPIKALKPVVRTPVVSKPTFTRATALVKMPERLQQVPRAKTALIAKTTRENLPNYNAKLVADVLNKKKMQPVDRPSMLSLREIKVGNCKTRPKDGHLAKRKGAGSGAPAARKYIRWCG